MPLRDSWRRALVFSGLVDANPSADPDYLLRPEPEPDPLSPPPPPAAPPYVPAHEVSEPDQGLSAPGEHAATGEHGDGYHHDQAEQIVVRRLGAPVRRPAPPPPADQVEAVDTWEEPDGRPPAPVPPPAAAPAEPPSAPAPAREVSVMRVAPRSFNDAQLVADRFKAHGPVVLDMQGVDTDLAKRLIGFASGLTYGLDGGMERLDGRVFLLTPRGVEIPAAQRARLAAQGSLNRV